MNKSLDRSGKTMYISVIKRCVDFIFALLGGILLSPVFIIVAFLVKMKLGAPVIFRQKRPGYKEEIFEMLKFRTMTDERDESGQLLPDEIRLTKFGKWLRATSLDELPELINILKGDMSIVGPRPLLVQYLSLYTEEQRRRHDVRPGITGYAQVHGRNSLTWERKFEYDIWYVEHVSLSVDMQIIFQTFRTVLKHEGISSATSETMEAFRGRKEE